MKFDTLVPGTFVQRDNRFRVQVRVKGRTNAAHLPNSGRLGELLVPGRSVWLAPADLTRNPRRRTAFDLVLVEFSGRLVAVDARLPGRLVAQALQHRIIKPFEGYANVQSEVRLGESRLDFRLDTQPPGRPCWIEVKSVTLVEKGIARFPDAPTLRGQRHVKELRRAVERGDRAAVVFVIQRDDATAFAPHDEADPDFGKTLREAIQAGVELHAWRCRVSLQAIELVAAVPALL